MALVENSTQVTRILDLKRERLFKKEVNEIMAMKVHCFSCVYEKCVKWHETEDGIEGFIRKLLKGRESDGFPLAMEDFLRESIRSFPYRESNLFKQLVRTIYPVVRGNEPTALSALTQSINGLQSANFSNSCYACGQGNSKKKCGQCKVAKYCSQDCQRRHWFTHKKHCKNLGIQHQKLLKEQEELEQLQKEAAAKEKAAKEKAEKEKAEKEEAQSQTKEITENSLTNGEDKSEVAEQQVDAAQATEQPVESS